MLADGLTDSDNSTFDELFAAFELPEQQPVNFSKKYKKKTFNYNINPIHRDVAY